MGCAGLICLLATSYQPSDNGFYIDFLAITVGVFGHLPVATVLAVQLVHVESLRFRAVCHSHRGAHLPPPSSLAIILAMCPREIVGPEDATAINVLCDVDPAHWRSAVS
jgi:hypothetical protein